MNLTDASVKFVLKINLILNFIPKCFQQFLIWNALRSKLIWTHYRLMPKVENEHVRF
jgi:hypothetical protein